MEQITSSLPFPKSLSPTEQGKNEKKGEKRLSELFLETVDLSMLSESSQEKINNEIESLKSKISKIDESIKNSKKIIATLKGGSAAKIFLIGSVMKFFFKLHNSKNLIQEKTILKDFSDKKENYEK